MRNFGCHFSKLGEKIRDWACWAALNSSAYPKGSTIIIDQFTFEETEKYIKLLIGIINKIQPCKLITKGKKEYISYKLIGLYNNDIVLLNFIRNLWDNPCNNYQELFFEKLKEIKNSKELTPFQKLTTANLYACKESGMTGYGNHSNCHGPEYLKVRKLPRNFKSVQIPETRDFLGGANSE